MACMAGTRRSTTRASRRVSMATMGPAAAAAAASPPSAASTSGRAASARSKGRGSAREIARIVTALSSMPDWEHPLTGAAGTSTSPSTSTTVSRGRLEAYLTMLREMVTSLEKRTS